MTVELAISKICLVNSLIFLANILRLPFFDTILSKSAGEATVG